MEDAGFHIHLVVDVQVNEHGGEVLEDCLPRNRPFVVLVGWFVIPVTQARFRVVGPTPGVVLTIRTGGGVVGPVGAV